MSTQVVLNLPDDTYERVTQFAAYAQRNVSEIVTAALTSVLPYRAGLNLNNEITLVVRRNWVSAGWHPPTI